MKKIFMTGSCLALALTSFSAYAVDISSGGIAYFDNTAPAIEDMEVDLPETSARDVNIFIGGNISLNGVAYSDDTKTATKDIGVKLPETFFGFGLEAGIKSEINNIWNATVTFAYDYAFDAEADIDSFMEDYISSVDTGFSAISATWDNYLRVSGEAKHRQDIVLGIGLGNATERIKMTTTTLGKANGLYDIDEDDDGTVVVLKVGYNYQISNHLDWYVNGRWFIPTDSDSDVDALFNANAGVRFVF